MKHVFVAIAAASLMAFAAVQFELFDSEQHETNVQEPKLRPGEWLDIHALRGSEVSPRQRERVSAEIAGFRVRAQGFGFPWTFIGPQNTGGRVVDLVVDPNTVNTVYAAAAPSGIWRSG